MALIIWTQTNHPRDRARAKGLNEKPPAPLTHARRFLIAPVTDAGLTQSDGEVTEPPPSQGDSRLDVLRRPRRGRRALRRQASVFRRLLANPPLRPFSWLASCLASLRTKPPNLPSATAWGFLRTGFFIAPLHFTAPLPIAKA